MTMRLMLMAVVSLLPVAVPAEQSREWLPAPSAGGPRAELGRSRLEAVMAMAQSPASQNPSPMVEHTRAHERLPPGAPAGIERSFAGPEGKPVQVFVPRGLARGGRHDLVVHFHGAAFVVERAVASLDAIAAVVNVGSGGGTYDRAFSAPATFDALVAGVEREASAAVGAPVMAGRMTLSAFSAGYGAVRAILREPRLFDRVGAVLLLDGLHTSYVPDRKVLADGGALDEAPLDVFVRFARAAAEGGTSMLITHSEIFPGTFASTTETTDYLLGALGLRRRAVLQWGPVGMQQLSEASRGRLAVMGFAGNSAPDHIDHLHGMPRFLQLLNQNQNPRNPRNPKIPWVSRCAAAVRR